MKKHNGMKPQDVAILLYICCLNKTDWKVMEVAHELKMSQSEVSESLNRSRIALLVDQKKKQVYRESLLEFIIHGLKYVFPVTIGTIVRGVATSHSAPPLRDMILQGEEVYVWPYKRGTQRGMAIDPLYKTMPEATLENKPFYELLTLVDAIRIGRVREVNLAIDELSKRLKDDQSKY